MKSVYLAGGISGLTKEEASQWRNEATDFLRTYNIRTFDPMLTDHVHDPGGVPYDTDYSKPRCSNEIFGEDITLINKSCVLFARLDTAKSIGTPWELGFAWAKGLNIVLVVNQELYHHPFIQGTTPYLYTDWEKALLQVPSVVNNENSIKRFFRRLRRSRI